jgi:hypothetical protein
MSKKELAEWHDFEFDEAHAFNFRKKGLGNLNPKLLEKAQGAVVYIGIKDELMYAGVSFCSHKDIWDAGAGLVIAYGRAKRATAVDSFESVHRIPKKLPVEREGTYEQSRKQFLKDIAYSIIESYIPSNKTDRRTYSVRVKGVPVMVSL